MQSIIKLITILLISIPSHAQFQLSGKIERADSSALVVNIPYIFGYYEENNINIPLDEKGHFNITLPIKEEKFVVINYNKQDYCLYLQPGGLLKMNINDSLKKLNITDGTLMKENALLQKLDFYDYPWFLKEHLTKDSTEKLRQTPAETIYEKFITPWLAQNQQKEKLIAASKLPEQTKQLFIQELNSIAICRANEFAWKFMDNRQITEFYKLLYGTISPKSVVANPGPMYFWLVDYYIGFLEGDAMKKMKEQNIASNQPLPYYNISLDSGNVVMKSKGKKFLNWIAVKNTNDAFVAEAYLAQQIFTTINEKDLSIARQLLNVFKSTYPQSKFYDELATRVQSLETTLSKNKHNESIRIFDNYKDISSIYPVIQSLKGKVVYLDVWGTWCWPCKMELRYTPALKEYFKDKDVAFVYLDMDDDDKDSIWKEFIRVNEMTGIHIRKNRQQIEPFWQELLKDATDKAAYYPQYFIFDQEGTLVIPKAKRPSDGDELYKQIEKLLK